jgi:predicted rRNA methylase YqxC with S4 and FtsJ domains
MKYKQVGIYQNINGNIGRNCNERWEIIKNYTNEVEHNLSIDVGSAEGFFVKRLSQCKVKNVISVEGTIETYGIQKK